jgi:hypothetical protein
MDFSAYAKMKDTNSWISMERNEIVAYPAMERKYVAKGFTNLTLSNDKLLPGGIWCVEKGNSRNAIEGGGFFDYLVDTIDVIRLDEMGVIGITDTERAVEFWTHEVTELQLNALPRLIIALTEAYHVHANIRCDQFVSIVWFFSSYLKEQDRLRSRTNIFHIRFWRARSAEIKHERAHGYEKRMHKCVVSRYISDRMQVGHDEILVES